MSETSRSTKRNVTVVMTVCCMLLLLVVIREEWNRESLHRKVSTNFFPQNSTMEEVFEQRVSRIAMSTRFHVELGTIGVGESAASAIPSLVPYQITTRDHLKQDELVYQISEKAVCNDGEDAVIVSLDRNRFVAFQNNSNKERCAIWESDGYYHRLQLTDIDEDGSVTSEEMFEMIELLL
ncbi:tudor domain-containing protein [Bacillus fonticola]|uniref:hypothetical protein n=1 Tax=Bacillus fonticola TaxID=2728853 RepID=UPI001472DE08|nr:hypothetical protein [Bacillus fonticola]